MDRTESRAETAEGRDAWQGLPRGWVACSRVANGIAAAVMLGGAVVFQFFITPRFESLDSVSALLWWAILALALVSAAYVVFWSRVSWRHTRWRLRAEGLQIERGVLWRHSLDIPRSRVQHTDVSDGPLLRNFELATLVVFTAGTRFARVELAGMGREIAFEVRDQLMPEPNAAPNAAPNMRAEGGSDDAAAAADEVSSADGFEFGGDARV